MNRLLLVATVLLAGCASGATSTGTTEPTASPTASPTPSPVPTPTITSTATPAPTPVSVDLPEGAITAADATARIGQLVTVCGSVAAATYAIESAGEPTFLSLERPYPDAVLTLVIWGEDRSFYATAPELAFAAGQQVCAEGLVSTYQGQPQIEPSTPITLLADWVPPTSNSFGFDCEGDAEWVEICMDIRSDYWAYMDAMYEDYDPSDYYVP